MAKKSIILKGLPGSGKSSLVKKITGDIHLENCHGGIRSSTYRVHSTDNYFSVTGEYLFNPTRLDEFHRYNREDFQLSCESGLDYVICDNTNTTWKEIEPYVKIAKDNGYEIQVLEPDTPWKFNPEECAKRNTHGVPLQAIERMLQRWTPTEEILENIKNAGN